MTVVTDLIHNSKTVVAVDVQAVASAGDVTGEIIDTQGFYAGMLQLALGSTASSKVKVKSFKQSDNSDMSDPEDIPSSNLEGLAVGTDIATLKSVKCINFVPTKRYVQAVVTTTTNGAIVGATAVLFGADVAGTVLE
jgi:hypothetical protein